MGLQQSPPIRTRMVGKEGIVTPEWANWFRSLKFFDDQINQSTADVYTTNVSLTLSQAGRIIKMNNGTEARICYLPSVASTDIGIYYTIMKLGSGNLRIKAADSDTIGNSSAGGALISAEPTRVGANVTLFLQSATMWIVNAGLGIWYVV